MRYVLAIDGGGIRGIIPALILKQLEQLSGQACCEMFDLMCGTSTGGMLSLGLSINKPGEARPFTAAELVHIYQHRGKDIFPRSLLQGVASVGGLADEKYSSAGLESVLAEYFGNATMQTAVTDVMVTSYDIEAREPFFFKSWKTHSQDVLMRHAARATTAAPTYFEPARVCINNTHRALIGGGVFMNNPAVSAYVEAKKRFPNEAIKVLSLGTGELVRSIPYEEAKDWGKVGWALPAMSCMFDGVSDAADHQMQVLLGDNYLRLQTDLNDADDNMDNVTDDNIQALSALAYNLVTENITALATFMGIPACDMTVIAPLKSDAVTTNSKLVDEKVGNTFDDELDDELAVT